MLTFKQFITETSVSQQFTKFYKQDAESIRYCMNVYREAKQRNIVKDDVTSLNDKFPNWWDLWDYITKLKTQLDQKSNKVIPVSEKESIVFQNDKATVIKIDTYGQSKKYGSTRWCISDLGDSKVHWESYKKMGFQIYFILLPNEEEAYQKIAVRTKPDTTVYTSNFDKKIPEIKVDELLQKYNIPGKLFNVNI